MIILYDYFFHIHLHTECHMILQRRHQAEEEYVREGERTADNSALSKEHKNSTFQAITLWKLSDLGDLSRRYQTNV